MTDKDKQEAMKTLEEDLQSIHNKKAFLERELMKADAETDLIIDKINKLGVM